MLEGEHSHEVPPVITPVVETESKLTEPLIDHAGKIAHMEERQSRHEEELIRQISGLEERLQNATGSQVSALAEKIAQLEARLEQATTTPVEEEVEGAVEFATPEIEESPAPPEKVKQGLRHRRKAKRGRQ